MSHVIVSPQKRAFTIYVVLTQRNMKLGIEKKKTSSYVVVKHVPLSN